ncbi:MAG: helix-turn-helix domain-containing protein [Actinomycetota bacterium]|nr:helix-turn-helix domain-containing protein [Actinomycetota bacterium]
MRTNELLREAFARSGLTQLRLAEYSGVPQGRISDYLRGRHEIGLPQLAKLLAALGFRADLVLSPLPHRRVAGMWIGDPGEQNPRVLEPAERTQVIAELLALSDAMTSARPPVPRPAPKPFHELVAASR